MKALLLFLVLVNALFFAWARWVAPSPTDGISATPEPDAQTLVLFTEKYPELAAAVRPADENPPAPASKPDTAPADATADDATAAAASTEGDSGANGADNTDGDADAGGSDDALVASAPAAAPARRQPEPVTALPAPARAAVEALTSNDAPDDAAPEPTTPQPATPTVVAAVATRCVTVGPFGKLPQANAATEALRALGGTVERRSEQARIWVGHWVHLPPSASRAAAVEVVEKLRADGVSDIYIESGSDLRNAISLGLFTDVSRAEIRAGKVRQLGVRPQIRDRFREGDQFWLDVTLPETASFDVAPFQLGPVPVTSSERECASEG